MSRAVAPLERHPAARQAVTDTARAPQGGGRDLRRGSGPPARPDRRCRSLIGTHGSPTPALPRRYACVRGSAAPMDATSVGPSRHAITPDMTQVIRAWQTSVQRHSPADGLGREAVDRDTLLCEPGPLACPARFDTTFSVSLAPPRSARRIRSVLAWRSSRVAGRVLHA